MIRYGKPNEVLLVQVKILHTKFTVCSACLNMMMHDAPENWIHKKPQNICYL